MTYETKGTVRHIGETQTNAAGTFSWREFSITDEDPKYPQILLFRVTKKNIDLLDAFREGQCVKVSFDIRGREYNGRVYINLEAWKVEGLDAPGTAEAAGGEDDAAMPF